MAITAVELGEEGESAHLEGQLVSGGFGGKGGVGTESVLHHLINLTPPALKSVGTDHKIHEPQAHVPTVSQCPGVGLLDLSDPIHLHFYGSRGADILACPTGHATVHIDVERGSHSFSRSSIGEANGIGSHDLLTGPDTEAAKDTVVFWIFSLEPAFFNPEFPGKVLNEGCLGAARQEKFDENLPGSKDSLRMGRDFDSFPGRVVKAVTRRDLPFSVTSTVQSLQDPWGVRSG